MIQMTTGRARPPAEPPGSPTHPSEAFLTPGLAGTPRPTFELPQRKPLGHITPAWVKAGAVFFITINAATRGGSPLLAGPTPKGLIASVRYIHESGDWFARLFLVMPDHVHGLISFPADQALAQRIAAWKGSTAKMLGVKWQQRFFEHRLRNDESLDEKAHYIKTNPVRAGLVAHAEAWPHVFDPFHSTGPVVPSGPSVKPGSAGTPRPTI